MRDAAREERTQPPPSVLEEATLQRAAERRQPKKRRQPERGVGAALLYSGVLEGAIAVAVLLGTGALLGLPPSAPLLALAFCGTLLVYLADRALGLSPEDRFNRPGRLAWVRRHRRGAAALALAAMLGAALTLPLLRPATLWAGAALGGVGLVYVVPVLPRGRRLKTVWFLKPVAISAAWAVGGVVLPAVEAGAPLTGGMAALVAYRFLFVGANALVADWGDRRGDARAGLCTVATEWPPQRVRQIATAALTLALGGGMAAVLFFGAPPLLLVDLAGPALLLFWVRRAEGPGRWTYGLVLDALVAWPAVTALGAWLGGWA